MGEVSGEQGLSDRHVGVSRACLDLGRHRARRVEKRTHKSACAGKVGVVGFR